MSTQDLAVKYRPKRLKEVVGQTQAKKQIEGMLKTKIPSSLLIIGPSGCGKTTLASIIAREVNGNTDDVQDINLATDGGKDSIINIIDSLKFKSQSKIKFIFGDEAHAMSAAAKSALLKPLENMPSNTAFIFITNQPEKLPEELRNRTQKLILSIPTAEETAERLRVICKKEEVKFGNNHKKILFKIANNAGGVPRESIQILGSLISAYKSRGKFKVEDLQASISAVLDSSLDLLSLQLLTAIYKKDLENCLKSILSTTDYMGLVCKSLELNNIMIDNIASVKTYVSANRRQLLTNLKGQKISETRILDVVDTLYQLKTIYVNDRNLMTIKVGKLCTS